MSSLSKPAGVVAEIASRATRFETPCGDGSMVWHSWGKGPPLVLLHGSHGSWMHWIRNISYLEKRFTVFAPDLPGYGGSSLPPRPDDADSFAEAIAHGIRAIINFDAPIDVVGFSLGGVLATHLAAVAPDIVNRLILVGTGGLDTPAGTMPTISYRGLSAADDIIAAHRQNLLAIMLHNPENLDPLALYLQSINIPLARLNARRLVMPDRLLHVLPRTDVPIDAIWGEFDGPHPNPEAQQDVLKRFRRDLDFRVVKKAGHWVMYESADSFNRELGSLLKLRH